MGSGAVCAVEDIRICRWASHSFHDPAFARGEYSAAAEFVVTAADGDAYFPLQRPRSALPWTGTLECQSLSKHAMFMHFLGTRWL